MMSEMCFDNTATIVQWPFCIKPSQEDTYTAYIHTYIPSACLHTRV
jgi:hypothetical protein